MIAATSNGVHHQLNSRYQHHDEGGHNPPKFIIAAGQRASDAVGAVSRGSNVNQPKQEHGAPHEDSDKVPRLGLSEHQCGNTTFIQDPPFFTGATPPNHSIRTRWNFSGCSSGIAWPAPGMNS